MERQRLLFELHKHVGSTSQGSSSGGPAVRVCELLLLIPAIEVNENILTPSQLLVCRMQSSATLGEILGVTDLHETLETAL